MPCVAPVTIAVWPSSLPMRMISSCCEHPSQVDLDAFQPVTPATNSDSTFVPATKTVTRSATAMPDIAIAMDMRIL